MYSVFAQSSLGVEAIYQNCPFLNKVGINDFQILTAVWNLFLAVFPLLLILFLRENYEHTGFKRIIHKIQAIIIGGIAFLFLPNAPYVIMDVRHLLDYCPADSINQICLNNAWMVAFFFSFSFIGWLVFSYILRELFELMKRVFDGEIAKIFIFTVIPVIALGVLLGLFNRWNSWDIFISPLKIINNVCLYFTDFIFIANWVFFSLFFYLLYFIGEFLFKRIDFYELFKNRKSN